MDNFNSGDHIFVLYNLVPKQSAKGDRTINIVLDVPHTEELFNELSHFLWKDVKVDMEKSSGGSAIQSEFYIANIQAKDFREGPRIRMLLRNSFEQSLYLKMAKLWDNDVKLSMEIIQHELGFDEPEAVVNG